MNRGFFVWLVLGILCIGGVGWYAWSHHDADEVHAQTAAVTSGPIVRRLVVAGTLQAVKSVDVGSQVSGQIKSLEADFNTIVTKGQVVAHIDPSTFQDALDNAEAGLGQAQAALQGYEVAVEDAQQKLTRAKELAAKQLIPQSDLDAAQIAADGAAADVAAGKAQVTRAEGSVETAKTDLAHTIITSPTDGIVVNRAVDVGQTVAASFQAPVLFTVAANIEAMQVQALVDEADVGGVQEGQDVEFQVESYPDETFHGKISQVRLQPTAATGAQAGGGGGGGGERCRIDCEHGRHVHDDHRRVERGSSPASGHDGDGGAHRFVACERDAHSKPGAAVPSVTRSAEGRWPERPLHGAHDWIGR